MIEASEVVQIVLFALYSYSLLEKWDMALEQPYRTALIATRARCAQILAPLADRLIYDLRNYHDREGGGFLTVELVAALDGLPNGREKIMRLWEEMTRKGTRGWRALMCILERMNPDVRRHLEEAAEQARMPSDSGYASPSNTPGEPKVYMTGGYGITDPAKLCVLGLCQVAFSFARCISRMF